MWIDHFGVIDTGVLYKFSFFFFIFEVLSVERLVYVMTPLSSVGRYQRLEVSFLPQFSRLP